MREPPTYRLHLEQIHNKIGNKSFLTVQDVEQCTGRSYHWLHDHLGIDRNGMTDVKLAMEMAKFDGC